MFEPFNYLTKVDCVDCGIRFPVHENIMTEVRCPECQGKWRAKKAAERHARGDFIKKEQSK